MRPVLVVLGAAFALASPAAAQIGRSQPGAEPLTGPWRPQLNFRTGAYDFPGFDDKTTRIDRRNSARFQAAKLARKARERAEREGGQPIRG